MDADRLELFEANRRRLFGLAYRLLGDATEAEDVVQDAYLRWMSSDDVAVPEAWLTTVVTNLCVKRLTSARARRECYVGPWIPGPVVTDGDALGPLDTVELRESISLGVLALLERLTPPERAVFVLREAFGHSHREIADILAIDEAHSRQLFRRARERMEGARKRFEADHRQRDQIVRRFLAASADGDLAELERLLADDVVAWADGGGAAAALRPVIGRDKVLRYLAGLGQRPEAARATMRSVEVNGGPAAAFLDGATLIAIVVPEVVSDEVTTVRLVINPDKLAFAAGQLG